MKTYERKTTVKKSAISKENCTKIFESALHAKGNVFKRSVGFRREIGINGVLSEFSTLKFYNMVSATQKLVTESLGQEIVKNANEVYFVYLEDGQIPPSLKWDKTIYTMHAISLCNGQHIKIKDQPYCLDAGDSITFNLNQVYELPKTSGRNMWLCCLFLPAGIIKTNI